jgi:hypothetical protein
MTNEEHTLIILQLKLDYKVCRCGVIGAHLNYEPGAITIKCLNCWVSFTAPDYEIQTALNGWAITTKQKKR